MTHGTPRLPTQLAPTGDLLAAAQEAAEAWSAVAAQPNLVVLRSAFVSAEVEGTPALFIVHDLHPGAVGASFQMSTVPVLFFDLPPSSLALPHQTAPCHVRSGCTSCLKPIPIPQPDCLGAVSHTRCR